MAEIDIVRTSDPEAAADTVVAEDRVPRIETVVRRENYRIALGPRALEIDPHDGASVVEFSLAGESVIVSREESPQAYGSSFWPSPQSDWSWPPPPEFAALAWDAAIEGGARVVLKSGTNEKLGLRAEQRWHAEPETGAFVVEYRLVNLASTPRKVAPWQNSRVAPGGLTFYASNEPTLPHSSLELRPRDGVVWYEHDSAKVKQSGKAFGDASEGWLAHVDGRLLFLKVFPNVPKERQAPGEAEIEIYVHDTGRFVEVEQQGSYDELQPFDPSSPDAGPHVSTWVVHWLVNRVPDDVEVAPGSASLLAFVRASAKAVESSAE